MRLHFEADRTKVVGNWHPDYGLQVSGQTPLRGGHLGVVGGRAFCAVRQRKHLPFRFGHIACMVVGLFCSQTVSFIQLGFELVLGCYE